MAYPTALALVLLAALQGEPPAAADGPAALPVPEEAPAAIRQLVADLAAEGVTVDFARRRVEVKGAILLDRMRPEYPIEYLIVNEGGYTHEALGIVRCTPSKLNAAFLALGLEPGRTARFVQKDPLPPLEQIRSGEAKEFDVFPAEGPIVDIAVRWTDEGGEHVRPIEDLVRYITNGRPVTRRGFVYVGSRFTRVIIGTEHVEKYAADMQGNLVSLFVEGSGNCLFDPGGVEGTEPYLYDVNTDLCPPRGTKVSFVFTPRA